MITNSSDGLKRNLTCEICFESFDLENRLPKSLPCCRKSLCRNCVQDIQRNLLCECPSCKARIPKESETIKTNLLLLNLIEEDSKWEKCPQHGESMKLVCLQDKHKLCAYCGLSSECKNHDLANMVDLKNVSDERMKELKDSLERVENKAKKCDEIINNSRTMFQVIVNENFEKQIFELRKAKAKTLIELNSVFNEKRKIITHSFEQQHVSLRDEVQAKIYEHMNFLKAKDPISLAQEDMSHLKARIESLIGGSQEISDLEQHLEKMAPLFRQKENNFDKLIHDLKGEISQKEMFGNVLVPADDEDEIHVQVSELDLECNDGALKCGYDMMKYKNMASFKLKNLREVNRVILKTESFDFIEVQLNALESIFANIVNISQISLFLESTTKLIPLEKLAHLFSIVFGKPQDIRNLIIHHPPNDDLLMMFNVLMPQFSLLNDLKVVFFAGKYSSNNFEDFAQNLSFIAPTLEKLDLYFPGTNFPISAFQKLFISMPKLEEFVLNAREMTSLNDSTLGITIRDMKNLMPKLQKFNLDASETKVTYAFAETLQSQIKFIPNLFIKTDIFLSSCPVPISSQLSRAISQRMSSVEKHDASSKASSETNILDFLTKLNSTKK